MRRPRRRPRGWHQPRPAPTTVRLPEARPARHPSGQGRVLDADRRRPPRDHPRRLGQRRRAMQRPRSGRDREDGTTFTVGLFEGSSDLNVACIEIAAYKATLSISANSNPAPTSSSRRRRRTAGLVHGPVGDHSPRSHDRVAYPTGVAMPPLSRRRAMSATTRRSRRVPSSGPPSRLSMRSNR